MKVKPLSTKDFAEHGKEIDGWFNEIAEHSGGEFTAQALYDGIDSKALYPFKCETDDGERMLGLVVVNIANYADGPCLVMVGGAGDMMAEDDQFLGAINYIAHQNKCVTVEARGRMGWIRRWKQYGFTQKYMVSRANVIPVELPQ